MAWHTVINSNPSKIVDFVAFFEKELDDARLEIKFNGHIEKNATELPGIVELRFRQYQEIESVLEMLNNKLKALRSQKFKKFLETYNRALTSSDAMKYVDGEKEVVDLCDLINEVAYVRNQYLGITKALEQKSFMLGHITKLRTAGLEDATF